MSVVEQIFWKFARGHRLGFEFRRQHPIDTYTLDFFCKEAMLAIEFDGEQHDAQVDAERDNHLRAFGSETLRIPNREFFMFDALEAPRPDWIETIVRRCEERSGRTVPR